jgi:hypothetical protein
MNQLVEDPPEPEPGAGVGAGAGDDEAAGAGDDEAPAAGDDAAAGAGLDVPPLLRKSVTYQPVPFNWKPAAVTCFLNVDLPQVGHSVNGASDIFCNTSLAKPQASQR